MQTIISSKLCWPQITVLVGSGFSGLFFELSKCSVHSSFAPLGSWMGSAKSYQSCQCQLKRGTFNKVSLLPSAKTIRYSADLPRMCMCGCRPSSVTSSGIVKDESTRKLGSPGGILKDELPAESVMARWVGGSLATTMPSRDWSVVALPSATY